MSHTVNINKHDVEKQNPAFPFEKSSCQIHRVDLNATMWTLEANSIKARSGKSLEEQLLHSGYNNICNFIEQHVTNTS